MKIPRIVHAVGHLDDDLIAAAAESKQKPHNLHWLKWTSVAACFVALAIVGAAVLPSFLGGEEPAADRYKPHSIQNETSAFVWPWEYKTIAEQYTNLSLNGVRYGSQGRTVSEELVDGLIGTYAVTGYDMYTEQQPTEHFAVYRLKYADQGQYVAVKMEEAYYVFKNETYAPPATLGDLFDVVDLPNAIALSRFSENGDGPDDRHYLLKDDDYLWQVLADCRSAEFVEDDWWMVHDREHLTFTVTSETLGVYRVAMYITADGYLWTNAFNYAYLFHIGEEAADKIIRYAKENATETEYEPYRRSIVGRITEITDTHILVDDTSLCKDPADGVTYQVPLKDRRISRHVDRELVKVGDTVEIPYDGAVDAQNGNTVGSPYDILRIRIVFENEENKADEGAEEMVTATTQRTSQAIISE